MKLTGNLTGMKIGILQEGFTHCEADITELVEASAQSLTKAGATVQDMSIPLHNTGWPTCLCNIRVVN